MSKSIYRMPHSKYAIEFSDDKHPSKYRILQNDKDVTAKVDNNVVRDLILEINRLNKVLDNHS